MVFARHKDLLLCSLASRHNCPTKVEYASSHPHPYAFSGNKLLRVIGEQVNIEVETLNEPFVLAISLDKASEEPLHQQISEPLRTMILNNELNPGQLLEDEVGMAKRLDTSHYGTPRLQNLADAGLLSTPARSPAPGSPLPPTCRKVSLTSLFDDLKDAGLGPETEILQYKIQFAGPETASLLDCDDDSEVVHIKEAPLQPRAPCRPHQYSHGI